MARAERQQLEEADRRNPLQYARPTIGAEHYVVRDTHWRTTLIVRQEADALLRALIPSVGQFRILLEDVILHPVLAQRMREGKGCWFLLLRWLADRLQVRAETIHPYALVSFWAHVLLRTKPAGMLYYSAAKGHGVRREELTLEELASEEQAFREQLAEAYGQPVVDLDAGDAVV